MIMDRFINIDFTKYHVLDKPSYKVSVGVYDKIDFDPNNNLKKGYELSELAYQFIDKINYKKYKNVELFFNREFKKLNNKLFDDFNVNINGRQVSRAWIKMYELLSDLKFFDNLDQKINAFHICEAPGNFINSAVFYINRKSPNKEYKWTAQSLASSMADFYDSYGFIKKTQSQWDLGIDKTGDITSIDNLRYYLDKYGNSDVMIGDCGEKWSINSSLSRDLSVFQMIYAILFPKIGGNFVIKSFATNFNKLYLSMLYLACTMYERIYTFKSNTNFWSSEIYIVGINKLKSIDTNILLDIAKNLLNNKITYPIDEIPKSFIDMYQSIMYEYILQYTDIKKFFVFLSTNDAIFNVAKDLIRQSVKEKMTKWTDKYL